MKIDFNQIILDEEGEAVEIAKRNAKLDQYGAPVDPKDNEPLTLGRAARAGLAVPDPDRTTPEQAMDDMAFAIRLFKGGEQEVTEEEVALLKRRIKLRFPSPVVSGRAGILLKGPIGVASKVLDEPATVKK